MLGNRNIFKIVIKLMCIAMLHISRASKVPDNKKIFYIKPDVQETDDDLYSYLPKMIGNPLFKIAQHLNATLLNLDDRFSILIYYSKVQRKVIPILVSKQVDRYKVCESYRILNKIQDIVEYEYHTQYKAQIEQECKDMYEDIKNICKNIVNQKILDIKDEFKSIQ